MKVKINDKCIGCGACVAITDQEIFDFNDEGLAYAKIENIDEKDTEIVEDAINGCPTGAIEKISD